MTSSFEANSPATFFQNAWKSEVLDMISPLLGTLMSFDPFALNWIEHLLSSIVVRIKHGVGSCISDGFDRLPPDQHPLVLIWVDMARHTAVKLLR
jgi:hypothetical protein